MTPKHIQQFAQQLCEADLGTNGSLRFYKVQDLTFSPCDAF